MIADLECPRCNNYTSLDDVGFDGGEFTCVHCGAEVEYNVFVETTLLFEEGEDEEYDD